jgi:hypothetical protein
MNTAIIIEEEMLPEEISMLLFCFCNDDDDIHCKYIG